jgi:hypothetical protein
LLFLVCTGAGNGAVKGPLHNYYIEYQVYSIYVIE